MPAIRNFLGPYQRAGIGFAVLIAMAAPWQSAQATDASPHPYTVEQPDGTPINSDLFLARDDGRDLRRLTRTRAIEVSPAWSPDGKRLAFVSDKTGAPHIYVMNRNGSSVERLTYGGSYNTSPAWSPDGRWIAYETRVGGQFDIWLIDPDGGVNVPLITHPRSDEGPAWAPDSRKLTDAGFRI